MITTSENSSARIREVKLALVALDLAGFTRTAMSYEALELATRLDDFYCRAATAITRRGGRVVKFMGDACFAVFAEEHCVEAVDAALALRRELEEARGAVLGLSLGANVHLAQVAEGELGPEGHRRYDVLGSGVNYLFRMGGGPGVRISEPVYRRLPNERRGAWDKHKPPATYVQR